MRHTLAALFCILIIIGGCKPKPGTTNGFGLPVDNKTTTDNSGKKRNWSDDYRKELRTEIHEYARKNGIPNTLDYGICVIDALEAKFPGENVDKQSAEAQQILQNCKTNNSQTPSLSDQSNTNNSAQWSAADQKEFMDNCTPGAVKSLNERAGTEYCDCMMKKLMQEYPNSKDVGNATESHLTQLAVACRRQVYD